MARERAPYASSREHLTDELRRVELLVRAQVERWRRGRRRAARRHRVGHRDPRPARGRALPRPRLHRAARRARPDRRPRRRHVATTPCELVDEIRAASRAHRARSCCASSGSGPALRPGPDRRQHRPGLPAGRARRALPPAVRLPRRRALGAQPVGRRCSPRSCARGRDGLPPSARASPDDAPLLAHRLVRVGRAGAVEDGLSTRSVVLDDRIVGFLSGEDHLEGWLADAVTPRRPAARGTSSCSPRSAWPTCSS